MWIVTTKEVLRRSSSTTTTTSTMIQQQQQQHPQPPKRIKKKPQQQKKHQLLFVFRYYGIFIVILLSFGRILWNTTTIRLIPTSSSSSDSSTTTATSISSSTTTTTTTTSSSSKIQEITEVTANRIETEKRNNDVVIISTTTPTTTSNRKYDEPIISTSSSTTSASSSTMIVTFVTHTQCKLGIEWYNWMIHLGYTTEHKLIALDFKTVNCFNNYNNQFEQQQSKIQYDIYYLSSDDNSNSNSSCFSSSSSSNSNSTTTTTTTQTNHNNIPHDQALKWNYIYSQLVDENENENDDEDENNKNNKKNILIMDVTTILTHYISFPTLFPDDDEQSNKYYDIYFSYGTWFPKQVFDQQGYTIYTGLLWLRNTVTIKTLLQQHILKLKNNNVQVKEEGGGVTGGVGVETTTTTNNNCGGCHGIIDSTTHSRTTTIPSCPTISATSSSATATTTTTTTISSSSSSLSSSLTTCSCNDQIVWNQLLSSSSITWDGNNVVDHVPTSKTDLQQKARSGTLYFNTAINMNDVQNTKKGEQQQQQQQQVSIHIWDRSFAFRGIYDGNGSGSSSSISSTTTTTTTGNKPTCPTFFMPLHHHRTLRPGETIFTNLQRFCNPKNIIKKHENIKQQQQQHPHQQQQQHIDYQLQPNSSLMDGSLTRTIPTSTTTTTTKRAVTTRTTIVPSNQTIIVTFTNDLMKEGALLWYKELSKLGYSEHRIVAMDDGSATFFKNQQSHQTTTTTTTTRTTTEIGEEEEEDGNDNNDEEKFFIRYDTLPHRLCGIRRDIQDLWALRWKYIYHQLVHHHTHVLMTDTDNIFTRYISLTELEESKYDVFHSYGTWFPKEVFVQMGLTVCGGFSWWRASPKVFPVLRHLLVERCNCTLDDRSIIPKSECDPECYCDDQLELNHMLSDGPHKIIWDPPLLPRPPNRTGNPLPEDWPWKATSGISMSTGHAVYIWDRRVAYRGPAMKKKKEEGQGGRVECFRNNWAYHPTFSSYRIRNDGVNLFQEYQAICGDTHKNKEMSGYDS